MGHHFSYSSWPCLHWHFKHCKASPSAWRTSLGSAFSLPDSHGQVFTARILVSSFLIVIPISHMYWPRLPTAFWFSPGSGRNYSGEVSCCAICLPHGGLKRWGWVGDISRSVGTATAGVNAIFSCCGEEGAQQTITSIYPSFSPAC